MSQAGYEFVQRHLAFDTDYVTFELDEYRNGQGQQRHLAHLRVHKPHRLKQIKRDWQAFRQVVTEPLYALPMLASSDPEFSKWVRFVTMMGWSDTGLTVLCLDGIRRPLYIHVTTTQDPANGHLCSIQHADQH